MNNLPQPGKLCQRVNLTHSLEKKKLINNFLICQSLDLVILCQLDRGALHYEIPIPSGTTDWESNRLFTCYLMNSHCSL